MKTLSSLIAACAITTLSCAGADAATYAVDFIDNDGPQWSGIVDTQTDTLTIQNWTEGAGDLPYWTPQTSALPLVFNAVTLAGASFDVVDDWDGTIGADWGFLSVLGKDRIAWNEGTFTGNTSRLGWGIAQYNNGDIRQGFADATFFNFVPHSATRNRISEANSLTVKEISPVPVPASLPLMALALGSFGWMELRRKRAT